MREDQQRPREKWSTSVRENVRRKLVIKRSVQLPLVEASGETTIGTQECGGISRSENVVAEHW